MPGNPFDTSTSRPGYGTIDLALLPPDTPVLRTCSYQYPLKLIAPSPIKLQVHDNLTTSATVHTVFLLTYGGGLVAGDTINLSVTLAPCTRLVLLTQGSTKIFKSPSVDVTTTQHTTFNAGNGSALCYLPDPVQPFELSAFEQRQSYFINEGEDANLCVCDWVSQGRAARGEEWSFRKYVSRNEVWMRMRDGRKRLMLRDNIILEAQSTDDHGVVHRMDGLGVFGTLIIRGDLFHKLGEYFIKEFSLLPQIGGRQWDAPKELSTLEKERAARVATEKADALLWTAAALRGFVVVKFGAREVEGAKRWLRNMLKAEGSAEREFGERALLCLG